MLTSHPHLKSCSISLTTIRADLDQSNQVDFRCISSSRHPRIDLSPHAFLSLDFISPPLVSILLYHSLSYASTKPEPSSVFRRQQAIKESVCAVRQSWWVICSSCVYHVDAHSWKCANDEERTISCVCAHVCSRSLAEVCVCVHFCYHWRAFQSRQVCSCVLMC